MADAIVIPRNLRDPMKAQRVVSTIPSVSQRLAGVSTVLQNATTKWRINVKDYSKLTAVVAIAAGGQGTATIALYPLGANATGDDTDGAVRLTAVDATDVVAADVANATQETITLNVAEYSYVELSIKASNTASDNIDLSFVDVFLA